MCRVWLSRPGVVAGAALSFLEMILTWIESVITWTGTGRDQVITGRIALLGCDLVGVCHVVTDAL